MGFDSSDAPRSATLSTNYLLTKESRSCSKWKAERYLPGTCVVIHSDAVGSLGHWDSEMGKLAVG